VVAPTLRLAEHSDRGRYPADVADLTPAKVKAVV
jgi:hypothetical protein